ncbi:MAG: hypothetical protein R3F61_24555 [Myxococcota bacterium]
MPTLPQMKQLRGCATVPGQLTSQEFRATTLAALAAAGIQIAETSTSGAGSQSLLLFSEDGGQTRLWAIPDTNLDFTDRARLDSIAGAYFASMFIDDLRPDQFHGALVLLARTGILELGGPDDGLYLDIQDGLAADGIDMPKVDFPAVTGDVWGGTNVLEAGLSAGTLSHFYVVQLAM